MSDEGAERGVGVVEPQVPVLARIEERRGDGHAVAEERPDGEGVEAALKLLAAIEDDVFPRRASGLVVAHQRVAAI